MTFDPARTQRLITAIAEWLGADPLLDGDTIESLAEEFVTSEWCPIPDATMIDVVPIIRTYLDRR